MKLIYKLLTKGKKGRTGEPQSPKGIVVHYTNSPNESAEIIWNYFENGAEIEERDMSSHYIVGLDGEIIQAIPEDEVSMYTGESNLLINEHMEQNNYLFIKCCHLTAEGYFSTQTYYSLIELLKDICTRYNFDVRECVLRHYDVLSKAPVYYVKNEAQWLNIINFVNGEITMKVFNSLDEIENDKIYAEEGYPIIKNLVDKNIIRVDERGKLNLEETIVKKYIFEYREKEIS